MGLKDGMKLQEFLDSDSRNAWVRHNNMQIYARKGQRIIRTNPLEKGVAVQTLDLANMVTQVRSRGKGRFWELLELLTGTLPRDKYGAIYIESVLNPRLETSLRLRGIQEVPSNPVSFVIWLG